MSQAGSNWPWRRCISAGNFAWLPCFLKGGRNNCNLDMWQILAGIFPPLHIENQLITRHNIINQIEHDLYCMYNCIYEKFRTLDRWMQDEWTGLHSSCITCSLDLTDLGSRSVNWTIVGDLLYCPADPVSIISWRWCKIERLWKKHSNGLLYLW